MKIGIVGTFGCGKTTLLADAQSLEVMQDYVFDIAIERRIAAECRKLHIYDDLERQALLTYHEAANLGRYSNYITDNPLHLVKVYTREINRIEQDRYHWLMKAYDLHRNAYDLLVYLPVEFPLPEGRPSYETDLRRRAIDRALRDLIDDYPHVILRGSPYQRLEQFAKAIKDSTNGI